MAIDRLSGSRSGPVERDRAVRWPMLEVQLRPHPWGMDTTCSGALDWLAELAPAIDSEAREEAAGHLAAGAVAVMR